MPLDPSIALQVQTPKFNTPFESLAQIYNLRELQQRQQLQQQQIQTAQALEQERQQKMKAAQLLSQAYTDSLDPASGEVDRGKLTANLTRLGVGDHIPVIMKTIDDANEAKSKAELARQQAREASTKADSEEIGYAKTIAQPMKDANYDPFIVQSMFNLAKSQGHSASVAPFEQVYQQDPQKFQAYVEKLLALPSEAPKPFKLSPGETQFNAAGQPIANVPAPEKPEPVTEATLDAQAQTLMTKKNLGQPLTPEEDAALKAYQSRKTVVADASAVAAANRQADTQAQQNKIQQASQDFTKQQAGRKELQDKVEQPYLDAQEKASTLRSVLAAAKQGNMEAANLTPLLATLGVVTSEGVKRINTTELNQVAGAGSLFERIKSQAGKLVAGQPLSPRLQSDLQELSTVLEQGARSKYEQGFNSTTKRYGLTDETMLNPAPTSQPTAATPVPSASSPQGRVPAVGEIRIINGKRAKWDGKGWLAVGG